MIQGAEMFRILQKGPSEDLPEGPIGTMMREHIHIREMGKQIRRVCVRLMGTDADRQQEIGNLRGFIDFARIYADQDHHGKEEDSLFRIMIEDLGDQVEHIIRSGMLVEHDMGRFHIQELEKALDAWEKSGSDQDKLEIIVNAGGWADLLDRHTQKEDMVLYQIALHALSPGAAAQLEEECSKFDADPVHIRERQERLAFLETLKNAE